MRWGRPPKRTRSLRSAYFRWLILFMLFAYALNVAVDRAHDLLADRLPKTVLGPEADEMLYILVANLIVLPLVLFVGWRIAGRMLAPVKSMLDVAGEIAAGRLKRRIPPQPAQEFQRVAGLLNRAFDRYDDVLEAFRRFSGNAAHQLRTPLTGIRSQGEITLEQPRSDEEYRAAIQDMLERVERLVRTTEQLLLLANLEAGERPQAFASLELGGIVRKVFDRYEPWLQEKAIQAQIETPLRLTARADAALVEELLANILDNAIRHTPQGGRIVATGRLAAPDRVLISIRDTGPGVPDALKTRAFERFLSVVADGEAAPGHAGLGLAIVAEIAHIHGGRAWIADPPDGPGAIVNVELPDRDVGAGT